MSVTSIIKFEASFKSTLIKTISLAGFGYIENAFTALGTSAMPVLLSKTSSLL